MSQFYADRVAIGSHRAKTPEGYLVCLGIPFARTGFQTYKARELDLPGDGTVKVYRRFDEVFNPATLASFEGKSVTTPHPPKFLNPDNDAAYARGHVQNVRQGPRLVDGEYSILCDLVIKDSMLISRIESGSIAELSAGYECEYVADDHSPDIYYQTVIRGNHVAVVPSGRAGSSVKILDSNTLEEEESLVAADTLTAVDDKVSVGALTGLLRLLGIGGAKSTIDASDPDGAVERNERMNREALRRARVRNNDADEEEEEMEEEEKGAKKPQDKKKSKDEKEKEEKEEKKHAVDSLSRIVKDAVEEALKKKKEEDGDEEEEEEEEEKPKKKAKDKKNKDDDDDKETHDADLIPTVTLKEGERPKNPIPGADRAMDSARALASLRAMKSHVADSRDQELIDKYNDAVAALKGLKKTRDGNYIDLARPRKSDAVRHSEGMSRMPAQDASEVCESFVQTARAFHRKNPNEAVEALASAGKEKK